MFQLSLRTFRDRWPLFIGAIVTVAVGVALVRSSLQVLASTVTPPAQPGLSPSQQTQLQLTYDDATTLMGMTTMLSVFLAVFIVSSTFAFTVAQRRRDLALLRLVGGARGQLRRLLLSEALLLGICGIVLGIPLGTPAVSVQSWLLIRLGFLPQDFSVAPASWTVIAASAAGLFVALLGVFAASRRAARIRPLEALREESGGGAVMTGARWFIGLSLLAGSVALVMLAQSVGLLIALALSMALTMAGGIALSLLSPLAVPLTGRLFGLAMRGSTIGGLAEANLRTSARRSAATASPLIVLVALLLGLSGTLGTLSKAAEIELAQVVDADLVVETTGAHVDRLATVPGVAVSSPQIPVPMTMTMPVISVDTDEPEVSEIQSGVVAVDPPAYRLTHRTGSLDGSLEELRGPTFAAVQREEEELTLGSVATANLEGQALSLRLVTILPERLSSSEEILVPKNLVPQDLLAEAEAQVMVKVSPGTEPRAVTDRIGAAGLGRAYPVSEWAAAQSARQQDTNVRTMVVLLGLAGLYALLAVINAVVIAGSERKREFAVARVSGMSRPQVVRMALVESCAVTVIGLFLGGLVVAGTLAGVGAGTKRALGVTVVVMPWQLLGVVVVGAFAAIGVTSVLTTLSATRYPPVGLVTARE